MNGINTIRLDLNVAKYHSATVRKRVASVEELNNSTEADKKKQYKTQLINEFGFSKESSTQQSGLIISKNDDRFYRANLLNEIVNKMRGVEKTIRPGQHIEYYA